MGSFNISVRSGDPGLRKVFTDAPPNVQNSLRAGSALLIRIPKIHWDKLIQSVGVALEAGRTIKGQDIQTDLTLGPEETTDLLAAVTFFAGFAVIRKESAEEIAAAAVEAGLLEAQRKANLVEYMTQVRTTKWTLSQTLEERQLANEVFPSLIDFEFTLDVRTQIRQHRVELAVPVIMVHVDTDKDDLYFQMNRFDLDNLITRLQDLRKQVEEAQEWIQASVKGSAKK